MACKIIVALVVLATTTSALIPTAKVLQGPGSKTTIYGPDGSALEAVFPGGTLVTDGDKPGLVVAGPAVLPSSPNVVVGGGPTGKIVTSYTLAGPAVVPVIEPLLKAAVLDNADDDDGSYHADKYE